MRSIKVIRLKRMIPFSAFSAFSVAFSVVIGILAVSVCALAAVPIPNPVPDTGQTQSYTDTFGEDSDYTINPPSYTKLDAQGNPLPDIGFIMEYGEGQCHRAYLGDEDR